MKKMKKLLSVLLAVVIALSCMSVMASAAKTNYKTVAELSAVTDGNTVTAYSAYSSYGQVTRLSTEARASIVLDFLDNVLPGLNINMGKLFDILGLSITIDLTSVDRALYSLDTIKGLLNASGLTAILVGIVKGIVNLGVLEKISFADWDTGMTRDGVTQLKIFEELIALLDANASKGVITDVLTNGLDLGIVGGMIQGLDTSEINKIVTGLPAMIKGLVFPLIERWDDKLSLIKTYDGRITGDGNVENTVNERVKKLFSDNMSITTVKYDANGEMTSEHKGMPIYTTVPGAPSNDSPRCYYYQNGNTLKIYHIVDQAEADASVKANKTDSTVKVLTAYTYVEQEETYYLEQEVPGSETYVWKTFEVDEDGEFVLNEKGEKKVLSTLKWYNDDSKLLRGGFNGDSFDLQTMSAGDILYKFIPALFEDLAVIVLNGSVKKILAEFFGARFEYVGIGGPEADDAVMALADSSNAFFTKEQEDYAFEYSDYAVINGTHYYRFEDQIFVGDTSRKNNYFDIVNWDYEFAGDFMDDFVPANDDITTERLLLNLNKFLVAVAKEMFKTETVSTTDNSGAIEEPRIWTFPELVDDDNSNLVNNIKAAAQAVISLAPEHIFGSDYETNPRCYYDMFMSNDNNIILTGIAAQLVDIIMPSMTLPTADELIEDETRVGAILAGVVREFAAYLTPEYNYDALIYEDFGTTTADPVKTFLKDQTSEYWFDVILTMGINVGFEYLRAFADMGEDTANWAGVTSVGYAPDGKTYAKGTSQADLNKQWEGMLDYIIDWALCSEKFGWRMEKLVDVDFNGDGKVDASDVDLKTAQDPFVKLDKILFGLLPIDEILTITPNSTYTSKVEKFLRYDLILGIVDLRWADLINTIQFNGPQNYFRTAGVLDQLAKLLKNIVNGLFKKVGSYSASEPYSFIPDAVTDFDSLAKQGNIATLASDLVSHLLEAYNNGLLDVALPFLNMFLGWKTDVQKLADPAIQLSFRDGNDYAYQWTEGTGDTPVGGTLNSTYIKITNNSAGMLEKHRKSSVTDHAYDIKINSVTSDATLNNLGFNIVTNGKTADGVPFIAPYETASIEVTGKYQGEETVTVTIEYEYLGKDGQAIGGKQYTSVTFLISNQYEDANVSGRVSGDDSNDKTGTNDFKRWHFTENVYDTVVNYQATIFYVAGLTGNSAKSRGAIAAPDWENREVVTGTDSCGDNVTTTEKYYFNMSAESAKYFAFRAEDADAGFASELNNDNSKSTKGYLYKAASGVTADTVIPDGRYHMGRVAVAYGSHNIRYTIDFIQYNDYDIYDIYAENKLNGYNANQGVDSAVYNEYNAAWKDIVKYATYPMMTEGNGHASTDYVATIQPHIPEAIERYEAAKEAYEEALAESGANASAGAAAKLPEYVTNLQKEIDNDFDANDKEINFQDYEYYEYFNYQDVKVAAENLYRTYLAPEVMDDYYIMGSGIRQAELKYVIGNEQNQFKKDAIEASVTMNDKDAVKASQEAHDTWEQPVTTKLVVEDFESRLAYYKQFLFVTDAEGNDNRENNDHMYFLNQEIAHLAAQGLDAADYTKATWDKYADALAVAQSVAAGTDEFSAYNSRIYDVKYNLMVAYKQLLAKDASLIEAGGTADLEANIIIAEGIFESLEAADGAWVVSEDYIANYIAANKTEDYTPTADHAMKAAYAELIKALGYNYQAVYTEHDAEVKSGEKTAGELKFNDDGTPMMFNLYADSAYEYKDNDRPNKAGNQAKVDAANAKLVAAMANFEKAVAEAPELGAIEGNTGAFGDVVVDEETGFTTGYIYGVTAGDAAEDYFALVNPDAGTVEWTVGTASNVNGTGAVATVKDTKGNAVAEFTLVIFGDVNGDAAITATDTATVSNAALGGAIDGVANQMAADTNGDASVTATDSATVANAALGGEITVNPHAA